MAASREDGQGPAGDQEAGAEAKLFASAPASSGQFVLPLKIQILKKEMGSLPAPQGMKSAPVVTVP